jgi:hypothetical protein
MARHYGRSKRLVDSIWIQHRMRLADARFEQRAAQPLGLQPAVVPYASIEIVRVDGTVETVQTDASAPTPEGQS